MLSENPWEKLQKQKYSRFAYFLIFISCGSGSLFLFDADPDPDPQRWVLPRGVLLLLVSKHVVFVLQAALDHLLHCLTRFHTIFQRHGLDPEIIGQANIFSKGVFFGFFWIFGVFFGFFWIFLDFLDFFGLFLIFFLIFWIFLEFIFFY